MTKPLPCSQLTDVARRRGVTVKGWRERYWGHTLLWEGKVSVRKQKIGKFSVRKGWRNEWAIDFWAEEKDLTKRNEFRKIAQQITRELKAWATNGLPSGSICPTNHFAPDEGNAPETEKSRGSATGGE